jgi:potassium-transporting ATPase KdpC subunit
VKTIRQALGALFFFVVATALYTGLVTLIGTAAFPKGSGGSILAIDGQARGSRLLGQEFSDPGDFQGRPSASGYDPSSGSGSNLGPASAALAGLIAQRRAALVSENGGDEPPADLLSASGSGLDPDISPAAADYQVARIVKARGLGSSGTADIDAMIDRLTRGRTLGFMGEARINVVELNLELDARFPRR